MHTLTLTGVILVVSFAVGQSLLSSTFELVAREAELPCDPIMAAPNLP